MLIQEKEGWIFISVIALRITQAKATVLEMSVYDKKYIVLHKEIMRMGITDEDELEKLTEQINSFSNLIIDLYLKQKV